MKIFIWLVVAVAAAAVGAGYYVYPQWTMQRIERAVAERDVVTLEALIDWPRLREGIKADVLGPTLVQASGQDKTGWSAAGAALGAAMMNTMIDSMVSASMLVQRPEAIKEGRKLSDALIGHRFATPAAYVMDFKIPDVPGFSLLMELQGATWRVTRLVPSAEMREVLGKGMAGTDAETRILDRLKRPSP